MTYEEVVKIIVSKGKLTSEYGEGEYKNSMYTWEGNVSFGANAIIDFEGTQKKVSFKHQFGLSNNI